MKKNCQHNPRLKSLLLNNHTINPLKYFTGHKQDTGSARLVDSQPV